MNQQKNLNPFELWKDLFNQSSTIIDENLKDESTSKVMGQVLEMNLLYKKMLNETTEQYFEQVNIPTRTDLSNISALIINVDSKVDDLEDLVEETASNLVSQAELKREMTDVKNKIKTLDNKLSEIISLLTKETTTTNKVASKETTKVQQG
ncbi:polyhydroxyalkanoic acid synthase subunit PhaR [Peribacillus asahii]|uniref:polyhydroxyalkanoic acid synthase subunit PhaR n=1 Tax=Peribacillus asahii TaxID=228899 RepID=UPI002079400C|nr:polyhydroxyalkanoic acid synthase subunit PhaR [Peribacillus asahii]USK60530.1 polyhydroxyalkanoic acid synthase subunit PhaR [Peribacillus asahii]